MESGEIELIEAILDAYRQGAFPMAEGRDAARLGKPVRWYRPFERAVLPIRPELLGLDQGVHMPRRLTRTYRQGKFRLTTDAAFDRVIRACAEPRRETPSSSTETWIDDRIIHAFELLHDAGHTHSIEAWLEKGTGELELVGGLYGLALGGVFCAESMFSRPEIGGTDASKVCLVKLIEHCTARGFSVIDTQFVNPHLEQFGVVEIETERYLDLLDDVGDQEISWLPFEAT
ncbi:MAG: leucyl/phenylalanyl-tRNA--protein transferase [Phycisphaerales bacterium]|nr:leucyl/phenylalanyl-tRNA--protein transferase [Phycisphaerales bacterium]MCB9835103.1 leucyl/phenylalanyl-tRNA--protein transferase [Phycisphaera sp.]